MLGPDRSQVLGESTTVKQPIPIRDLTKFDQMREVS
jgi:hypothetical protein